MKIAVVSHGFPPFLASCGGIASYAYNLSTSLSELGLDVTVFCGSPTPSLSRHGTLTINRLLYPLSAKVPPNFLWFQLRNRRELIDKLKEFDLIHSQSPENTISVLGKLKSRNAKWVITFHSSLQRELQAFFSEPTSQWSIRDTATNVLGMPLMEALTRFEIKYSDHYFFTARTNVADYSKFYSVVPSKSTLIPNGVDVDEMDRVLAQAGNNTIEKQILVFGRLYVRKGFDLAIRAIKHVIREHNDATLVVIGSGPQESKLRSLVKNLNLEKNVFFRGYVTRQELLREIVRSAVVVFPSFYEVQCTSTLEAMGLRKPVVAFKIPSMQEIISHMKTGYLVDERNSLKLGRALSFLLDDERLARKLGSNAYNYVCQVHDWKILARKYLQTYRMIT